MWNDLTRHAENVRVASPGSYRQLVAGFIAADGLMDVLGPEAHEATPFLDWRVETPHRDTALVHFGTDEIGLGIGCEILGACSNL